MEDVKKELENHEDRIRMLENEVAENRKEWKLISRIEETVNKINASTARTEENIKELRKDIDFDRQEIQGLKKQRDDDHYVKPLTKRDKLNDTLIAGVIMLVLGAIIGAILSNIGL